MAKKTTTNYKNVKINEEEFATTTIGELDNAEQSMTFIFILFGIILIFVFCLPSIVNLIKKNDEKIDYSINKKEEKEKTPEEKTEKEQFYTLTNDLSIMLNNDITIHHFSLDNDTINFQVTNNGDKRYSFLAEKYFLELYTVDNTLLERIWLGDIIISKNDGNKNYEYALNDSVSENINKLLFVKKEETDYPNIILEKNENNQEVLTCSNKIETITYKFQNEKLYEIGDVVNYAQTETDYQENFNNYRTQSNYLNSLEGITSVFVDNTNNFIVNTSIDLKSVKETNLNNSKYYRKDTLAKVVDFEMEAQGFRCK